MTKYNRQTAAPEVQANTTLSQTLPKTSNVLKPADREARVHPTDKYVIIINPQSEYKLGLVNKELKKLGPCNVSCEYRRTGTIVKFSSESDLAKCKTLLAAHNVDFCNDKQTTKFVLKGLSPAFNPRDIQSELVESGFEVIKVNNMVS